MLWLRYDAPSALSTATTIAPSDLYSSCAENSGKEDDAHMLRLCSVVAEAGLYVRKKYRQPQEENNSRRQHRMDTSRQLSQFPTSSGNDLGTAKVRTGV